MRKKKAIIKSRDDLQRLFKIGKYYEEKLSPDAEQRRERKIIPIRGLFINIKNCRLLINNNSRQVSKSALMELNKHIYDKINRIFEVIPRNCRIKHFYYLTK